MKDVIKLIIKRQPMNAESETSDISWLDCADAILLDPIKDKITDFKGVENCTFILDEGDPQRDSYWKEIEACQWVCGKGLNRISQYQDEWAELNWVPRLNVYKPQMTYRFSGPAIGEGFSFYIPDTSVIKGWRVTDGDLPLSDAVKRVEDLGFSSLWLHSPDAESNGKGLDLEMLDKVQDSHLDIWISGGVTDTKHLSNLAKFGGASRVIVDEAFIREVGLEDVLAALEPKVEEHIIPVSIGCAKANKVV